LGNHVPENAYSRPLQPSKRGHDERVWSLIQLVSEQQEAIGQFRLFAIRGGCSCRGSGNIYATSAELEETLLAAQAEVSAEVVFVRDFLAVFLFILCSPFPLLLLPVAAVFEGLKGLLLLRRFGVENSELEVALGVDDLPPNNRKSTQNHNGQKSE
jgi:hypothetical protein